MKDNESALLGMRNYINAICTNANSREGLSYVINVDSPLQWELGALVANNDPHVT